MFNTLRLLMNRFRPETRIHPNQSKSSQGLKKETEQIEHREKLIHVRNHMDELTTTNAFDINSIRQKVHEELRASDLSARQKDRASINKWFNKCDLTDSGSFDITAFQRRMEELARAEEEVFMETLPPQEDILMAFGKPEHDFFESEKISLSGVFQRMNANEDFDEDYSTPLLPMYHCNDEVISEGQRAVNDVFCVEETGEQLIADAIPTPVPAFIAIPAIEETFHAERAPSTIDPSVLFEEWSKQEDFNPLAARETRPDERIEEPAEVCDSQIADTQPAKSGFKSHAKTVSKPSSRYWTDSDRLTRFGRRKTSASCSSTRIRSFTQIA